MALKKFRMVDLILKKKNGETYTPEEIKFIANGIKNETIPDYQISAWLMAICFKGMSLDENACLTKEMAESGEVLDLSDLGEYVIDKHSTGGVGDKVTLILIPLLAAAGLPVAKLSGRGLGFTGGTIDKLESIPGYNVSLSLDEFKNQVKITGAAIVAQTRNLTPVDGKLYALRDVTGTIDSVPLIASSVVSKKIAAGSNVIILDVKYGNGAFMKTVEDAEILSKRMVEIGKKLNRSITAVITSMDQPLGKAIGNSLEVVESIETLQNKGPVDLTSLTLELGAIALVKSYKASSKEEAILKLKELLENGQAFEKFKEIVKAQNGNVEAIEDVSLLPSAQYKKEFIAKESGFVQEIDAMIIAKACKIIGAGREKKEDKIDYSVGIVLNKKIADEVSIGESLLTIYSNDLELEKIALELVEKAFKIASSKCSEPKLIDKIIE